MNYAPEGKPAPVVEKGEFPFAAVALDHGHIYGQCKGLTEAGGELKYVYDPDPAKVEKFCATFPGVRAAAQHRGEVLEKPEIKLVAAAAVPSERGPLGLRVMDAGKDYFTDKTPFTTLDQLAAARAEGRGDAARNTWSISASGCTWSAPCAPGSSSSRARSAASCR